MFSFHLNTLITERKEAQLQLKKEVTHQKAVNQFTTSIENFATLTASLSAYVDNHSAMPLAQELQSFAIKTLDKIQFKDSIVISYLDTNHTFIYSFDKRSINQADLVGTNVSAIRDQVEIDFLNNVMKDDELHLSRPINLVEGWLGIPMIFSIRKDDKSIGYLAPIVNFSSIVNSLYTSYDAEEFYFKFEADGSDFDRGAIYDGSKVYSTYDDKEYYRKHDINDSFLITNLKLYGYKFSIGTALKSSEVITVYQTTLIYGFIFLIGVFLSFLGIQRKRNIKINETLVSNKEYISNQNLVLVEAKEKFDNLLTNLGDGVFELDDIGKFTYINQKMLQMLNMKRSDVISTSIWDMIYHEDVLAMRNFYGKKFQRLVKNCSYEYRLNAKGGEPLWVEQNTTMQYEGRRMVKLQSIARDISETKSLKLELDEKESLIRLVSENSSDLIALHELDGTYKYVSPSCFDLTGYEPAELVGRNPYDFVHPDDIPSIRKVPHQSTLDGREISEFEYRIRKKDGSYIWMESYAKPIRNSDGEVVSAQTSSRDITEKKAEKRQLEQAKVKAEEASLAKDNFLSMMSHEIRTPLNGIIGAAHLLINNAPSPNQLSHLHILRQSSDNLRAIVNDILDFSKIEEGKIELENAVLDLQDLLETIHAHYHLIASEKGVKVHLYFGKKVSQYYVGDSVRIAQVIHNLMSNAVKFTNTGFIKLSVSISKQHDAFDEVRFSIEDSGVGISPEQQKTIFGVFTQADKSTTRKFGGSGLGLAIMKRLLGIMDSEVKITSAIGKGAKFEFKLALERESENSKNVKKLNTPDAFVPLSGNVLIVEDNAFNMTIARDFLKHWGCTTYEAINGKKALEVLKAENIDLVLMDLQMPVMDGYETIKAIRRKKKKYYKEMPVVALTAAALGDIKEKIFQSGMNDFITKPFHPSEFYNKISKFLEKVDEIIVNKDIIHHITEKLSSTLQDKNAADKYLHIFIEIITEESIYLEKALESKSIDEIKVYAHKNKSTLRMVGLDSLSDESEQLENMIEKRHPELSIFSITKKHLNQISELLKQLKSP